MECGRSRVEDERIVGGRAAREGEFPYLASIQKYGSHVCGGIIISRDTMLTAAHCVRRRNVTDLQQKLGMRVEAGKTDLRKNATHSQSRRVKSIISHEKFGTNGMRNDIALLKLQEPFDLEDSEGYVAPICLPDPEQSSSLRGNIIVSGWGATREGGHGSDTMWMVEVVFF
ncbi:serine protease 27-like [Ornithodoros turicata]|uniref:serine protease 27-like n=1 Tax=Ornithodoros turicata TaxID=34597 RepID=UPI003139D335